MNQAIMKRKRWIIVLLLGSIAVISAVLINHNLEQKRLQGFLYYTNSENGSTTLQTYEHSFDNKVKKAVSVDGYSRIYRVATAENGVVIAAVTQDNNQCIVYNRNDGTRSETQIDVPSDTNSPVNALAATEGEIIYQLQDGSLYKIDCTAKETTFLINGKVRGVLASMGDIVLFEQTIEGTNWISMYQNGETEALFPGEMPLILSEQAFLYYSEEAKAVLEYDLGTKSSVPSELAYVPERYTSFDEFRQPVVKKDWVIGCEKTFRYDSPLPGAKFKLVATNLKTGKRITVSDFHGERIYSLVWSDWQVEL